MVDATANGKLTLYLVRHAQTPGNVTNTMVEPATDVLTDIGQIQANLLGMHLAHVQFDYAFSSDYGRAVRTLEGIIKHSLMSKQLATTQDKRLREVDFGEYQTRTYEETLTYCRSLNVHTLEWEFPGGESLPGAGHRMLKFIEEICEDAMTIDNGKSTKTVLLVSHSLAIACFLNSLHRIGRHTLINWNPSKDLKLMGNASYLKIEVETITTNAVFENGQVKEDRPVFKFTFLQKHYREHLQCISSLWKNSLENFAKANGKEYLGCIQQ